MMSVNMGLDAAVLSCDMAVLSEDKTVESVRRAALSVRLSAAAKESCWLDGDTADKVSFVFWEVSLSGKFLVLRLSIATYSFASESFPVFCGRGETVSISFFPCEECDATEHATIIKMIDIVRN